MKKQSSSCVNSMKPHINRDPHHEEAVKQLRQFYETAYQP